jgi:ABC-2 type transport system ATP-binding protein
VDALASRTLKDLLLKLTARGITVFLTSHVLEIVERLCTHIAIITEGRLVVEGALGELRRGIALGDESGASSSPLSLEDYFIRVIGGARPADEEMLTWLA